jgi:putative hydrolase of the HAD superfamily
MISVVCFDLDDTLCDSQKSSKASLLKMIRYALTKCEGLETEHFQEAYNKASKDMIKKYNGPSIFNRLSGYETRVEHIRRTLILCGFDDPNLVRELVDIYGEERRKTLKLFPDAIRVLSSLKIKYRLSIVTNGPSDIQRGKIEVLKIACYFNDILISGEVGYAKPDPRIFDPLITKNTIPASQYLYVGNSQDDDLTSAHYAGLKVVWINRKGEVLKKTIPKPHYEIKNLSELLGFL